jgi:hypothetical protein
MLRIDAGQASGYCDGLDRRNFLQLGVAGMAAAALGGVLGARAASPSVKDTAVILLWLDGGPSHLDLYDLKPEAPEEYRGFWKPIKTNVPGVEIGELFPKQATVADKFSIVRSLSHDTGDHFRGAHWMLTGRGGQVSGAKQDAEFPGVGSIVSKLRGPNTAGVPAYVGLPNLHSVGLVPGYHGANFLGSAYNPFAVSDDPNGPNFRVQNLRPAGGMTLAHLEDRKHLLGAFDTMRRDVDRAGTLGTLDKFQREAYELATGPAARHAFEIGKEDPRLRDRYGRHGFGQSCLLARRLVEGGVTFVTVVFSGWDHHWDLREGMERYLPQVDSAVASLFADLDDRGLLERTLVVLCGEFSRTPRMNDGLGKGKPGRDHWGGSMFCLMGGGGVKGGRIVGSTDRLGTAPKDRPLAPADIHATMYHVLGIDPATRLLDRQGRPVPVSESAEPIAELL